MWNRPRGLARFIAQTRNSRFTAATAAGDQLILHTHSLFNTELCRLRQYTITGRLLTLYRSFQIDESIDQELLKAKKHKTSAAKGITARYEQLPRN